MKEVLCFINAGHHYEDNIYNDILNEKEIFIIFKGQRVKKHHDITLKTLLPHFFYRKKNHKNFQYIGKAFKKKIIQERDINNILQMEYKINILNNIIPYNTEIKSIKKSNGKRCFKINCFNELDLIPISKDMTPGIILAKIKIIKDFDFRNL